MKLPVRSSSAVMLTALLVLGAVFMGRTDAAQTGFVDWKAYGGDKANSKRTGLNQINRSNVHELEIAWTWQSPDNDIPADDLQGTRFAYESTPLAVDGRLYVTTSTSQVAALDGVTGEPIWTYDPRAWENTPSHGIFIHRGAVWWESAGERRLFVGTVDGRLIALDPATGAPVPSFGTGGAVDLTEGLRRELDTGHYSVSSPPIVVGDVIVVGGSITDANPTLQRIPGDVRGYDVRTGRLLWTFHTIPQAGEFGNETWENDSWRRTGNTNVWTVMSADEELGYVYLPTSTPTNDWYGGHRPGDNLFAESLVCLNARTGERVWHFQMVRHGIWDYDLPAAPNLVDIVVDGRQVKAVAQVSKQGWVYVFDRVTGEPVWPIFDRPVPASLVPGEKTSPTQPFPSWPLPFERQGVSENDLIDFTPELRAEALELLADVEFGPLFAPFVLDKGLFYAPGPLGGANWTGAAFDPDTHVLYVPSINRPSIFKIVKADPAISDADYVWETDRREGPQGLPFVKPPYGSVTAIDLDTGEHVWRAPLGEGPRNHPALRDLDLPRLGWPHRGAPLLTPELLLIGQEARHWAFVRSLIGGATLTDEQQEEMMNFYPRFFAYDKNTGELLFEMELPRNVTGAPMTYMAHGRQYVVFATGGVLAPANLTALALPGR